jgi:hypothetical protein
MVAAIRGGRSRYDFGLNSMYLWNGINPSRGLESNVLQAFHVWGLHLYGTHRHQKLEPNTLKENHGREVAL